MQGLLYRQENCFSAFGMSFLFLFVAFLFCDVSFFLNVLIDLIIVQASLV